MLTSPDGSWFSRGGGAHFRNSSVGVTTTNFSHKFVNSVRNNNNTGGHGHKKPLPKRRNVDEESIGDNSSAGAGDFEQATALHDCK